MDKEISDISCQEVRIFESREEVEVGDEHTRPPCTNEICGFGHSS